MLKDHPQIINKKQPTIPKKRYTFLINRKKLKFLFLTLNQSLLYEEEKQNCDASMSMIYITDLLYFRSVSTNNDNAIVSQEGDEAFEEETPNKVKKVELEIQSDKDDSSTGTNSDVGEFRISNQSLLVLYRIEYGV